MNEWLKSDGFCLVEERVSRPAKRRTCRALMLSTRSADSAEISSRSLRSCGVLDRSKMLLDKGVVDREKSGVVPRLSAVVAEAAAVAAAAAALSSAARTLFVSTSRRMEPMVLLETEESNASTTFKRMLEVILLLSSKEMVL